MPTNVLTIALLALIGLLALVALVLRAVLLSTRSRHPQAGHQDTFEPNLSLLTNAERSFFGVLEHAVPHNHRLFAKVRLADIIHPTPCGSRSAHQASFNRISAKHVDFLICHPATLKVLVAIELDDKSHSQLERGFRDAFVDTALASAGIPVLRFPVRATYSPSELSAKIALALRSMRVGSGHANPGAPAAATFAHTNL